VAREAKLHALAPSGQSLGGIGRSLPDVEEDVSPAMYESKVLEARVLEETVLAQTATAR